MKYPRVHFLLIALCLVSLVYCDGAVSSSDAEIDGTNSLQTDDCGKHETYTRCDANPSCQKTCENLGTWESEPCIKTKDCISGCICKEGYARDENGACIWENRCPRVRH